MKSKVSGGLIEFEFDEELLKVIEDALGSMKSESRKVLKNAVNQTAKQAKKDLAKKAQETYVVKQGRFTKAMKTKNASESNPTATIKVTGAQLELKDFKASPAGVRTGKNRPSAVKAKVLLSSGMKPLVASTKAFIVKFKSGHVSIAQRRGKPRYPIKKLLSNSIPVMIGNEDRVYGVVEPEIYDHLMDNIIKEIRRITK